MKTIKRYAPDIVLILLTVLPFLALPETFPRIFYSYGKKLNKYLITRKVFQYDIRNIKFDPELGYAGRT
jgi:hypothetical protein